MADEEDEGNDSDVEFSDSSVDAELVRSKSQKPMAPDNPVEGRILSFFRNLTGNRIMQESDVRQVLRNMREHLIKKNVAANIADKICSSVGDSIMGKPLTTFSAVTQMIKDATELALKQILTFTKTGADIFMEMAEAKRRGKVYTIAFIGVNGVGKSTNLSKVCFWAMKKGFKVMIVACDTFRAGAVEQLRTHVKALSSSSGVYEPGCNAAGRVELFERGYGKDPSSIAKAAIEYSQKHGFDVVLIDTAGRMQDNEPLMRSLGKLIGENQPDKIVFVGEALVGNEALDQLSKFNKALKDFGGGPANESRRRQIDGIILSKLDTIDDKVGASISMSYITGKPILFVGTGQSYGDLRVMNVKTLVTTLLNP